MTADQKKKCHAIIHAHALTAGASNAVPVPGLGVAADMVAMTTMTMSLCTLFGGDISKEASKTLAIAAMKNAMLKQPIRILTKEISKFVPILGQLVAPTITIAIFESAGWILAEELSRNNKATHLSHVPADSLLIKLPKSPKKPRKNVARKSTKPKPA